MNAPPRLDLALSVRSASLTIRGLIAIVFAAAAGLLVYGAAKMLSLGGAVAMAIAFAITVVAATAILAGCFVLAPESRLGRWLSGSAASLAVVVAVLFLGGATVLGMILVRR